ncbi:MAG: T9SS type A sorting domain-containing protein [Bacteroidota bacterium]
MKTKHIITLFFALVTSVGFAQAITYTYSPSGNRTMRRYDVSPFRVGNLDSTKSSHVFSTTLMQNGLSFYPNPSTDRVVFTINDYTYSVKSSITLLDEMGKEIQSIKVNSSKTEMDVSHLPDGLYFVKLTKNEVSVIYKLVKIN